MGRSSPETEGTMYVLYGSMLGDVWATEGAVLLDAMLARGG
jgi:hypothetical protein